MLNWIKQSRKAIGAGVGVFLASFPLVDVIEGDQIGDPKVLAYQAAVSAIVAAITYRLPNDPA